MTRKQKKMLWRILGAAALLLSAFLADRLLAEGWPVAAVMCLYLPAYFLAGYDVLRRAALGIVRGRVFDENFLMALATLGALAIGYLPGGEPEFAEAVFVMVFYQTGELFQSVAVGKSRRSIAALMDIRPDMARVVRNGQEIEVAPDTVAVGETLVVRPGEKIPLDGVVSDGFSDLNTVALTGESAPRAVAVGDPVISGCTNMTGRLIVTVTKIYGESTVARVLELMERTGAKKTKSERFITRFARYYTPAVVAAALILAFVPPLFAASYAAALPLWLARALTFLVVSCPCALVISVPLSFFGGLGGASRFGVLIKGAVDLENLSRVSVAVFDKTGTLTEGGFAVTAAHAVSDEAELRRLAASAEYDSNHPIALALKAAYDGAPSHPDATEERAGRGVVAMIGGRRVAVGNRKLMAEEGVEAPPAQDVGTAVYVSADGVYQGYLLITDAVKPGAAAALADLASLGVERRVMLTGDRAAVAKEVAETVGVTEWRAELLPADKVREVEVLLAAPRRGKLLFAGDGINDAPVLARADVGVAMGALGSDAAIEAADVVLMDDDPRKIARAVRHARRTCRIVRENIAFALFVKLAVLVCLAVGLFGRLQMPLAVFADVGVAVLCILNAMRALSVKHV